MAQKTLCWLELILQRKQARNAHIACYPNSIKEQQFLKFHYTPKAIVMVSLNTGQRETNVASSLTHTIRIIWVTWSIIYKDKTASSGWRI